MGCIYGQAAMCSNYPVEAGLFYIYYSILCLPPFLKRRCETIYSVLTPRATKINPNPVLQLQLQPFTDWSVQLTYYYYDKKFHWMKKFFKTVDYNYKSIVKFHNTLTPFFFFCLLAFFLVLFLRADVRADWLTFPLFNLTMVFPAWESVTNLTNNTEEKSVMSALGIRSFVRSLLVGWLARLFSLIYIKWVWFDCSCDDLFHPSYDFLIWIASK